VDGLRAPYSRLHRVNTTGNPKSPFECRRREEDYSESPFIASRALNKTESFCAPVKSPSRFLSFTWPFAKERSSSHSSGECPCALIGLAPDQPFVTSKLQNSKPCGRAMLISPQPDSWENTRQNQAGRVLKLFVIVGWDGKRTHIQTRR